MNIEVAVKSIGNDDDEIESDTNNSSDTSEKEDKDINSTELLHKKRKRIKIVKI